MAGLPLDALDPAAWLAKHLGGSSSSSTSSSGPSFLSKEPALETTKSQSEASSVVKKEVSQPASVFSFSSKKSKPLVVEEKPSCLFPPNEDHTIDDLELDFELIHALDEIKELERKSLEAVGYQHKLDSSATANQPAVIKAEPLAKKEPTEDGEGNTPPPLLLCCRCMEWDGLCSSTDFSRPELCGWDAAVDLTNKQPQCAWLSKTTTTTMGPVCGLVGDLFVDVIYSMLDDCSLLRLSQTCTTLYLFITKWLDLWRHRTDRLIGRHFGSSFAQQVLRSWQKDALHLPTKARYDKLKFFQRQQELALDKLGIGRPSSLMCWAQSWHAVSYDDAYRVDYRSRNNNQEPPRKVQYFRRGRDSRRERNGEPITHVTFAGGVFYVPDEKLAAFGRAYVDDARRGVNLYVCEHPTTAFPLFLDVDLVERDQPTQAYLEAIVREVVRGADEATDFEASTNSSVLVYTAPLVWRRAKGERPREWRYKTGLHVFWSNYFVDPSSARLIRNAIVQHLIGALGERENPWCVAVDDAVYSNGLRLFASYRAETCPLCKGSGVVGVDGAPAVPKARKRRRKCGGDLAMVRRGDGDEDAKRYCHPKLRGQAKLRVKPHYTGCKEEEEEEEEELARATPTQPCFRCLGARKVHVDRRYRLWRVVDGFTDQASEELYERYSSDLGAQFEATTLRRPDLCKDLGDERVVRPEQLPEWVRAINPRDLVPAPSLADGMARFAAGPHSGQKPRKRKRGRADSDLMLERLPSSSSSLDYTPKRIKQERSLVLKVEKAIKRRYEFMQVDQHRIASVDWEASSNYYIAKSTCKWCPNIMKEHTSSTVWFAVGPHCMAVHCFSRKAIVRPVGRCYCRDMRADPVKTPHKLRNLLFPALVAEEQEQQKLRAQFDVSRDSDYVQVVDCPQSARRTKRIRVVEEQEEEKSGDEEEEDVL